MKDAKQELIRELKKRNGKVPYMSAEARRLFYSLHTRWSDLQRMVKQGRDVCGQQADHPDAMTRAAEGRDVAI